MRRSVIVVVLAAAVSACSGQQGNSPSTTAQAAVNQGHHLGEVIAFARADTGVRIGTATITQSVTVPADCSLDPVPVGGQLIGLWMEIINDGPLMLPEPTLEIQVTDTAGFTQTAKMPQVALPCRQQYPELPSSVAPGKTRGWVLVQPKQPDPAAVIYTPLVGAPDSTLDSIKLVPVTPANATVSLPHLQAGPAAPATSVAPTSTTQAPAPTTHVPEASSPVVGAACDPTEGKRGATAGGQSVECALAGAGSPHWVRAAPSVGTRTIGTACAAGSPGLAISPDDQDLVCVGNPGTWQPGP